MKKFLFFLSVIFSLQIFSSGISCPGLLHNIEQIDLDDQRQENLKSFLLLEGINTFEELTVSAQKRLVVIMESRHNTTNTKISLLRSMFEPLDYENNKKIINFLSNHCHDLEGLVVCTIAALESFDRTVDLDDATTSMKDIISSQSKEKFFTGKYSDCFNPSLKKLA